MTFDPGHSIPQDNVRPEPTDAQAAQSPRDTILAIIDAFSTDKVLDDYCITLAKSLNAAIELFDVQFTARELMAVPPVQAPEEVEKQPIPELEHAEERMRTRCALLQKRWPFTNYSIFKSPTYGKIPRESDYWLKKVQAVKPALVVMREHEEPNLLRAFFGSDERRLVEQTIRPVLMLPGSLQHMGGLDNIIYLLSRHHPLWQATIDLQLLARIMNKDTGRVHVLYYTDDDQAAAELEVGVIRSKVLSQIMPENMHHIDIQLGQADDLTPDHSLLNASSMIAYPLEAVPELEERAGFDLSTRLRIRSDFPVLFF